MRVVIFEDEQYTAERLQKLLKRYSSDIQVLQVIPSVKEGIAWFSENPQPELIFMDIRLSDGSCFELFEAVKLRAPIIFTTAYDEYALRAFQVYALDYLVKPIDFQDLKRALEKYEQWASQPQTPLETQEKKRFLIKIGEQYRWIPVEEIAYFHALNGAVWLVTDQGKRYPLENSLDRIEQQLNPQVFFRLNRQFLSRIESIEQIHSFFNSRLKVILQPKNEERVLVSRERVGLFKAWLDK
jgi:DNA-binding LytR/AlgR family response regulator